MNQSETTITELLGNPQNIPALQERMAGIEDVELLQTVLSDLFQQIDGLSKKLQQAQESNELSQSLVDKQMGRLNEIRHGITELTERMLRPYIVLPELQAIKNVLDTLSSTGTCNSVILEGEPGTGKTAWPYEEVGQELQEGKDTMLVHVRVKETMNAQDLLYTIDDVRRLNDAQTKSQVPEEMRKEAITWRDKIVAGDIDPTNNGDYQAFVSKLQAVSELSEHTKDLNYINYVELGSLGEAIKQSGEGKTVWLLIDEIEKGREELMTGMLDEIENLEFTISETGTHIKGDKKNLRIVITTNLEDSDKIPPSFRRRSLYHFMQYPTPAEMAQIVELNFKDIDQELLDYALDVFYSYHQNPEVEKKPSTPELLAWLQVLIREYEGVLPEDVPHKEILLKFRDDHELEIEKLQVQTKEQMMTSDDELPHFVHRAIQGEPVFKLTDQLNQYESQEEMASFYALLKNSGASFITPQFNEEEGPWDGYEYPIEQKLVKGFQLIIPGVESLGNGYYVIPPEKIDLLKNVISKQIQVTTEGTEFSRIEKETTEFTKGRVIISDQEKEAYVTKDGLVVIEEDYVP